MEIRNDSFFQHFLKISQIIKQINLYMNPSNPAPNLTFETPSRSSKGGVQNESFLKGSPPPTIQPHTYQSSLYDEYSAKTQLPSSASRQVKIRISDKSNKSHLQRSPNPVDYENQREYGHLNQEQLLSIIQKYEAQIEHLKEYIHRSDLLDRNKIVQIFGLDYTCCNGTSIQQSKLVLKQLTTKVKQLISENHKLKTYRTFPSSSPANKKQRSQVGTMDYLDEHLLVKENEKLRMIIDEYKKSEDIEVNRIRHQMNKFKMENESLKDTIRNYKNRIQTLEENARYRENKEISYNGLGSPISNPQHNISGWEGKSRRKQPIFGQDNYQSQLRPKDKPIIPQIKPIKQDFNTKESGKFSKEDIQYAKKQITKQMYEVGEELRTKNQKNIAVIEELGRKIQSLQDKLKEYEKQRRMVIDSTIRKSKLLTQSMLKHRGDVDVDGYSFDNEYNHDGSLSNLSERRQEGRIRTTNNFLIKKPEILIRDENEESTPQFRNSSISDRQASRSLSEQRKLLEDKLAMEQLKNRNNLEQINMLKVKLGEAQAKLEEKIERNIQLEGMITKLQSCLDKNASNIPYTQVQRQIHLIRESLKVCQIDNFEHFFKDFNEILKQRNYLSKSIENCKSAANQSTYWSRKSQQKQQQGRDHAALLQKISELTEQNKRLLKKLSQLENQLQKYHQEVIYSEIEKLNSINLNDMNSPSGVSSQNALRWQKQVKDSIESSINRLERLEKKINEMEGQKSRQKIVKSSKAQ